MTSDQIQFVFYFEEWFMILGIDLNTSHDSWWWYYIGADEGQVSDGNNKKKDITEEDDGQRSD